MWCNLVHPTLRTSPGKVPPEKQEVEICRIFNDTATDCQILLKFGMLMIYGSAEVTKLLNLYAGALWASCNESRERLARRRAASSCSASQLPLFYSMMNDTSLYQMSRPPSPLSLKALASVLTTKFVLCVIWHSSAKRINKSIKY